MPTALSDFNFFFFNDTATTDTHTLSLHDALPIFARSGRADVFLSAQAVALAPHADRVDVTLRGADGGAEDRKSTRLNSSHRCISYAVFCLKKKRAGRSKTANGQVRSSTCPKLRSP